MDAPITELLIEGAWLMVAGLTIVFGFLFVLVGVLMVMSWAVRRWGPIDPSLVAPGSTPLPAAPSDEDGRITAAIAAALAAHRRRVER
jgi:sodium pump decarboxylase gamma subunit